jgi:DNA polymerase-3 subunit gamma/tau
VVGGGPKGGGAALAGGVAAGSVASMRAAPAGSAPSGTSSEFGGGYGSGDQIAGGAPDRSPSRVAGGAPDIGEPWSTLITRLELGGAARQLASNCQVMSRQGSVLRLALDARNKHMRTPAQEDKLAQALSRHFGQPIRLEFETAASGIETPALAEQRASMEDLDAARRAFESDPGVQGLRERFGATLLPDTIRPVK